MNLRVERLSSMTRQAPQPSRRLLAAAAAERAGVERERVKLLALRDSLQGRIDEVNGRLDELAERVQLIDRLSGANGAGQPPPTIAAESSVADGAIVLRGPAIRQTAVKVLLENPRRPQALHYRDWFALLDRAGYAVAGKDPLAVFLTQLSRSPVIQRGTQSGVYELNLGAVSRLRRELADRQGQLRALTSATTRATDLSAIRIQRTSLTQEIDRLEKALEEAELAIENIPSSLAAAS